VITLVALALAFFLLPPPWNWLTVVVAAIVDIAETGLFVWWSKRRRATVGVETLVGRRGIAATALAPRGQIRVAGEIWEAASSKHVDPGDEVVVRSIDGLVLAVEPVEGGRP
jgi:membrane protein implicated in regulation of membrane protease activity